MAERIDITDEESARAWLEKQDHQTQVWFAARCALRALPALGTWADATTSGVAFSTCRAMLVSAATATHPAAEMMSLRMAADSAASAARSAVTFSVTAAYSATFSAARSAYSAALSAILSATADSAAAFSVAAADSAACSAASADANAPGNWKRLWHDAPQPEGLVTGWDDLKAQWAADGPPHWSFWIEWYEAILNGTPLPWDLTQRIALEVTEDEWNEGPATVAARINEIRARFKVAAEAEALNASLSAPVDASRLPPRGHNNPPEIIDDTSLIEDVGELRRALTILQQQAGSTNPDKEEVVEAVETVERWYHSVLHWLGRKLDLAVDTAIKWAIPAGGGYILLNPAQMNRLIEATKVWLPFLH